MGTFTINEVLQRVREARKSRDYFQKSASVILNETVRAQKTDKNYDIFLSHASADAEVILGVKMSLEDFGYSVYIDWIDDPQLDRSRVSAETAEVLRSRMNRCQSLFYATTTSSVDSKWMPWECGYFDGKKGRTVILPVTGSSQSEFAGREYLGLYPYITKEPKKQDRKMTIWVNKSPSVYVAFDDWLKGKEPRRH